MMSGGLKGRLSELICAVYSILCTAIGLNLGLGFVCACVFCMFSLNNSQLVCLRACVFVCELGIFSWLTVSLIVRRDVKLGLSDRRSLNFHNRLLTDDQIDSRQLWHVICWWWVVSVHNN